MSNLNLKVGGFYTYGSLISKIHEIKGNRVYYTLLSSDVYFTESRHRTRESFASLYNKTQCIIKLRKIISWI